MALASSAWFFLPSFASRGFFKGRRRDFFFAADFMAYSSVPEGSQHSFSHQESSEPIARRSDLLDIVV
jgi:hypothetical protein